MDPKAFSLTNHAIKRLRERFPMIARQLDSLPAPYLKVKKTYDLLASSVDVTDELKMYDNPIFKEKYGQVPHVFFKNNHILFIGRLEPKPSIVTVVNWTGSVLMMQNPRGKYPHEILPPAPAQPPRDADLALLEPLPADLREGQRLPA